MSAAYEALTGQRTLGRAEELGVWFSVRRIIYVTRSDQFQKGLRDAGESPLRYNAEPSWSLQQAAEYRRGWLLKQSDYIPSWLDDPCWVAARLVLLLSFKAIERMAASAAAFGFDGTDVERFDKELEAHRPLDFRPLVVE